MSNPSRVGFLLVAVAAPLLLPAVIYCLVALSSGLGVAETLEALLGQMRGQRPNLAATSVLGLIPVLPLLLVVRLLRRFDPTNRWRRAAGWGGLLAVLAVLAWANFEAWPLFLPGRTFPGWPHGIELVIAPLIFAPIAMGGGALVGGLVARRRR